MTDCCESKENGFKCTCVKTGWAYSQQAEDDGLGDHKRDEQRDRAWEETDNMKRHNDFEED